MNIVYTAIIGDYDNLIEPVATRDWEYICYTTQSGLKSKIWEIRKVEKEADLVRQARKMKIIPPFDCKQCIWIDANIRMCCKVQRYFKEINRVKTGIRDFSVVRHPHRNNIKDEAAAIIRLNKDDPKVIEKQLEAYSFEGFVAQVELPATGLMYRRMTDKVKEVCDLWLYQIEKFSRRDQMSFSYACWKCGFNPRFLPHTLLYPNRGDEVLFNLLRHKK